MKKFLTIIIFLLLFLVISPINISTNTQTKSIQANELAENKINTENKNNDNNVAKKQNITNNNTDNEVKKENNITNNEIKKENSKVVQTTTTQKPVQNNNTTLKTDNTNYGTYGRLYVSNYSVALYDFNVYTQSSTSLQKIVDNKDSAAYYVNNGKLVIADHYYQGFSVLASLNEGTTSYIKFKNGTTIKYTLIKKAKGFNVGPDLIDTKGNSFFEMDGDILMYTCYENGIMATLWNLTQ